MNATVGLGSYAVWPVVIYKVILESHDKTTCCFGGLSEGEFYDVLMWPLEWELGNLVLFFSFAIFLYDVRPPTCYSNSDINLQKEELDQYLLFNFQVSIIWSFQIKFML